MTFAIEVGEDDAGVRAQQRREFLHSEEGALDVDREQMVVHVLGRRLEGREG